MTQTISHAQEIDALIFDRQLLGAPLNKLNAQGALRYGEHGGADVDADHVCRVAGQRHGLAGQQPCP